MVYKLKEHISENLFDKNFRKHPMNYVLQCFIIFICISIVLFLYEFFGGIIVASLGASSFIVFVTPLTNGSRSRYVIGGYICGAVIGVLFGLLHGWVSTMGLDGTKYFLILICAATVAVTAFIMVITNSEHPPAAALALGLSVDPTSIKTALAALLGVMIICLIRRLFKKRLKNLI